MFEVIATNSENARKGKKAKVTCTTCKLKGCVGRCHFEAVKGPRAPKAA
jgi:hypothetical protein